MINGITAASATRAPWNGLPVPRRLDLDAGRATAAGVTSARRSLIRSGRDGLDARVAHGADFIGQRDEVDAAEVIAAAAASGIDRPGQQALDRLRQRRARLRLVHDGIFVVDD